MFDYCLSLVIYFSKKALQKLINCYNFCLFKLFNVNEKIDNRFPSDFNKLNNKLEFQFGIFYLTHRIIVKLMLFSHRIINDSNSPVVLKNQFIFNNVLNKNYSLRNINNIYQPKSTSLNNYGENNFLYFFIIIYPDCPFKIDYIIGFVKKLCILF